MSLLKSEVPVVEKNFDKDLKTFERLPDKTKELELLRDQGEKSIGQACANLNKMIWEKSKQAPIRPIWLLL